jgi:hypothetical protein
VSSCRRCSADQSGIIFAKPKSGELGPRESSESGVEVWKIDKAVLVDWMPAQSLPDKGAHGMKLTIPVWENK